MAGQPLRALNKYSTGKPCALTPAPTCRDGSPLTWDTWTVSTVAQLDIMSVSVEAGGRVTLPLNVRNTGEVVEDYLVEILGVPSAWTTVDPQHFTLYPGTAQVATVDVHPPRSSEVPAGELRMGVHVLPTEHPDQAVVPEAVVEVLPFLETTAELVPHTSHGRFGAKHQVAIDNRGNVPVTVLIMPIAGSDALRVTADPKTLTVDPGQAAFGDVRAKPVRRLWRGMPRTLPFSLTVAPQAGREVRLEAGHVQDPVLPRWFLKALLALLALGLLLVALWSLVLRPTIESAAKEAVAEPVKAALAQAEVAKQAAAQAQQGQAKAAGSAADSAVAAKKAQTLVGVPPQPRTVTAPFSGRLAVTRSPLAEGTSTYTIPKGNTLSLTDFVLENAQGDSGVLRVTLDAQTLFTQALESFRTTDYHFVTPFVAKAGSKLGLTVRCNRAGTPPDTKPAPTQCRNAITFGGPLTQPAP